MDRAVINRNIWSQNKGEIVMKIRFFLGRFSLETQIPLSLPVPLNNPFPLNLTNFFLCLLYYVFSFTHNNLCTHKCLCLWNSHNFVWRLFLGINSSVLINKVISKLRELVVIRRVFYYIGG